MKNISIILTHWSQDDRRNVACTATLQSIWETTRHLPAEIIVFDNGGNPEFSAFLLRQVEAKQIHFYIRSSENLYFGFGRNVGYDISCGDYLVFTDNDIRYKAGWLELAIEILEANPDKKIAFTPLRTDKMHRRHVCWAGELEHKGQKYLLNLRAGSNSWVMRREDFLKVGRFRNHRVAGSKWTDAFSRAGFKMVTMEENPLAEDVGFRKGYDFNKDIELRRKFLDGSSLLINN